MGGNGGEFVVGVGGGCAGEHGFDDALGDEICKAAVGGGGVGVVEGGEAEVAGLVLRLFRVAAGGEDVLAGAHELDDGERKVGVVDGIGGALRLQKDVERGGIGRGGELCAFGGDEGYDAGPALGRAHDAADGAAAGLAESERHGLVGGDHEVFDEGGGAIVGEGLEGLNFAVDDDRVGFDAVEVKGAHGGALGAEALGGGILQAELGGKGWIAEEFRLGAGVGPWIVFKPGADGGVGELGLVADEGGVNGGCGEQACGGDGELNDEGAAVLLVVEAGEVCGKLDGEHGEVVDGGVDGLGLGLGGEVEGGALGDDGGYVGDADKDADGAFGGLPGVCDLGILNLIEVAGGVVVDGRPEEGTEVFQAGRWRGGEVAADAGELFGGSGGVFRAGGENVEAFADHFSTGGGGEVEWWGRDGCGHAS